MNESESTIRLPWQTHRLIQDIDRCKRLIRHYIKHDAYVEYDWLGSPDAGDHDTLTRRLGYRRTQMRQKPSAETGATGPELRSIPLTWLVDSTDSKKVEYGTLPSVSWSAKWQRCIG